MPANLSPQYRAAESAYRRAQNDQEALECLQEMLRLLPKHKGTDRLHGDLKAKIAKLKASHSGNESSSASSKSALKIPKQGAGRVLLLGLPNSGKSQLLVSLTRASTEVSEIPCTTRVPIPGMMYFEDCPIQLIEIPSIIPEMLDPQVLDWVRNSDLVLFVADTSSSFWIEELQSLLACFSKGKTRIRTSNEVPVKMRGVTSTPAMILLNKSDVPGPENRVGIWKEWADYEIPAWETSGITGRGLDTVERLAFQELRAVRVYPRLNDPDPNISPTPWIIREGQTLLDIAKQIHADFPAKTNSAKVWSASLHPGTNVKLDYLPKDGDRVEFVCH